MLANFLLFSAKCVRPASKDRAESPALGGARSVEQIGAGVRLKLPKLLASHGRRAVERSLISACEAPPPRPFCKPLGPPAPLVAIPLEVVQGPTQLVVAGPDFAEELLNG